MTRPDQLLPVLHGPAAFRTTRWSLVLRAGHSEGERAGEALEQLCRGYWFPLYLYARRCGNMPEDAQDLVQGFLAELIKRNDLATVAPEYGRFRSFLLAGLNHYIANERKRGRTSKRGGGFLLVSLEERQAEEFSGWEAADPATPENLYEHRWARTVLERALTRLRLEYARTEKGELFEELKDFLSEKKASSRAEIAARRGIGVNTVDVAIHRLRKRYAELLRDEVAQTVLRPEEIDDEIRHLISVVAQDPLTG